MERSCGHQLVVASLQYRLSCDDLSRKYKWKFLWLAFLGFLAFILYRFMMNLSDVYYTSWSFKAFECLKLIDCVIAPRTILEAGAVANAKGLNYYKVLLIHHAAIAVLGLYFVLISLRNSTGSIDYRAKTTTPKKMLASVVIFVFTLLFRPPDFQSSSLMLNSVDNNGIYFMRESIVMAFGYFNLYVIVLNVWASLKSR